MTESGELPGIRDCIINNIDLDDDRFYFMVSINHRYICVLMDRFEKVLYSSNPVVKDLDTI